MENEETQLEEEEYTLPDLQVLFDNMLAANDADLTGMEVIQAYLKDAGKGFISVMRGLDNIGFWKDEPSKQEENLRHYHLIVGGMIGLTNAVIKRVKYLCYFQLTEGERDLTTVVKKSKLTQGDRDNYSRGKCAFEEALLTQLENIEKNINGRLSALRGQINHYRR